VASVVVMSAEIHKAHVHADDLSTMAWDCASHRDSSTLAEARVTPPITQHEVQPADVLDLQEAVRNDAEAESAVAVHSPVNCVAQLEDAMAVSSSRPMGPLVERASVTETARQRDSHTSAPVEANSTPLQILVQPEPTVTKDGSMQHAVQIECSAAAEEATHSPSAFQQVALSSVVLVPCAPTQDDPRFQGTNVAVQELGLALPVTMTLHDNDAVAETVRGITEPQITAAASTPWSASGAQSPWTAVVDVHPHNSMASDMPVLEAIGTSPHAETSMTLKDVNAHAEEAGLAAVSVATSERVEIGSAMQACDSKAQLVHSEADMLGSLGILSAMHAAPVSHTSQVADAMPQALAGMGATPGAVEQPLTDVITGSQVPHNTCMGAAAAMQNAIPAEVQTSAKCMHGSTPSLGHVQPAHRGEVEAGAAPVSHTSPVADAMPQALAGIFASAGAMEPALADMDNGAHRAHYTDTGAGLVQAEANSAPVTVGPSHTLSVADALPTALAGRVASPGAMAPPLADIGAGVAMVNSMPAEVQTPGNNMLASIPSLGHVQPAVLVLKAIEAEANANPVTVGPSHTSLVADDLPDAPARIVATPGGAEPAVKDMATDVTSPSHTVMNAGVAVVNGQPAQVQTPGNNMVASTPSLGHAEPALTALKVVEANAVPAILGPRHTSVDAGGLPGGVVGEVATPAVNNHSADLTISTQTFHQAYEGTSAAAINPVHADPQAAGEHRLSSKGSFGHSQPSSMPAISGAKAEVEAVLRSHTSLAAGTLPETQLKGVAAPVAHHSNQGTALSHADAQSAAQHDTGKIALFVDNQHAAAAVLSSVLGGVSPALLYGHICSAVLAGAQHVKHDGALLQYD
jgi:hypothetical protein